MTEITYKTFNGLPHGTNYQAKVTLRRGLDRILKSCNTEQIKKLAAAQEKILVMEIELQQLKHEAEHVAVAVIVGN